MKALVAALLCGSCAGVQFVDRTPPQPDGPGTCATVATNAERLGGCGLDPSTIEQHCLDAEEAGAEDGVPLPKGCMTAAVTCDVFWACTPKRP